MDEVVKVPLATGVLVMAAGALLSRFNIEALLEFLRDVVAELTLPLLLIVVVVELLLLLGVGVLTAAIKQG